MKPDMFRRPVSILVGLGYLAEVRSVMDAYRHLSECPTSLRDSAHAIALKACSAALRGEIDVERVACLRPSPRNTICWRRKPI